MKKVWVSIVASLASLILIGAVVFVGVWGSINYARVQEMMSGTNIYTKEDLEKAAQDAYNTALANKAEYLALINNYRDAMEVLRAEKEQAQGDNAALQAVNDKLVKACEEYKTVIETLSNDELAVVSFECDGILYNIDVLPKGQKLSAIIAQVMVPAKPNYDFVGWSTDGTDIVDDSLMINENTTLIAVFEIHKFTVKFGSNVVYETTVDAGGYLTADDIQALREKLGYTDAKYVFGFRDATLNRGVGDDEAMLKYQITGDTIFTYVVTEHTGDTSGEILPVDPELGH